MPRDKNGAKGDLTEFALGAGLVDGQLIIDKFCRNDDVDGAEDIWNGGSTYTGFPLDALPVETLSVLSDNAADTLLGTGARKVRVYYHDDDYNMFNDSGFLYVDVEMDGVTPVDTGIDVRRVWSARVILSGSGETNAGKVTGRWTTTTAVIFFALPAGFGQTQIGNFTIPSGYTGYLKQYHFTLNDNNANNGEVGFRVRTFASNTFRQIFSGKVSTTKDYQDTFIKGAYLEEKSDVVASVFSITNANGIATCNFEIYLIKN